MILTLFDFDGNSLGYTDKVISAYQDIMFNGIGSSEYHLDKNDPLYSVTLNNKYLILEQDGNFQSIVTGTCINEDFTIYCRSLNWLLSKIVLPPVSLSGTAYEIVNKMRTSAYGGNILMGASPSFTKTLSFVSEEATIFSETLKGFLDKEQLGHTLRFSHTNNRFYLDIIKGQNLNFYISEDDETLENLTLSNDILDVFNSLCYKQEFEVLETWHPGANNPPLFQDRSSNLGKCYRINTTEEGYSRFGYDWYNGDYIYCDNLTGTWKKSNGHPEPFYRYLPNEDLAKKYQWFFISNRRTKEDADNELSKKVSKFTFNASAKNIIYLKDYKLGDFVKLQYTQNNTLKTHSCQFTQITLSRDNMENKENPTLEEVI